MTELSKEKIAEIAYKAIKKWFDTNVSSTLKQKNINVTNACLALYQYFKDTLKNKNIDQQEELKNKISESGLSLGLLLCSSLIYAVSKTKILKKGYFQIDYVSIIARVFIYTVVSLIIPSITIFYWLLGSICIVLVSCIIYSVQNIFYVYVSKIAGLQSLDFVKTEYEDVINYLKLNELAVIDDNCFSEKLNALSEAVNGFYTED